MKTQRDLQLPIPLESLKSFLDQQAAMDGGRLVCHECGSVMGHVDGTFWLYGTDGEWMLHLPVCACSERESLGSPNQRREECPTSEPATSLVAGAGWKEMYRTALFEPDKRKQRHLLHLAEKAVVFRARPGSANVCTYSAKSPVAARRQRRRRVPEPFPHDISCPRRKACRLA